jgi:hypothetical protein
MKNRVDDEADMAVSKDKMRVKGFCMVITTLVNLKLFQNKL